MTGSDLTLDAMKAAFRPLTLLPNVPEMNHELWLTLGNLFASEGITRTELALACTALTKTQRFWPPPALIIETVKSQRVERFKAKEEAERLAKLDSARQLAGPERERGDTHYERQRQAMKKQLGLGEYRSAAHKQRYKAEIEVKDPYLPPSLRKALEGGEPEEAPRGPVRRLL